VNRLGPPFFNAQQEWQNRRIGEQIFFVFFLAQLYDLQKLSNKRNTNQKEKKKRRKPSNTRQTMNEKI